MIVVRELLGHPKTILLEALGQMDWWSGPENYAAQTGRFVSWQFLAIGWAPRREGIARSSPAGDPCVAFSSSHIRRRFHTRGRSDSAGHCRRVVAR